LDDRVRVQAVITNDKVRLDATRLVKLSEFKKAVERLKKSMLAPPTEETMQVLRRLHPEPNPDIIDPTADEPTPTPMELLREFFEEVMRNLPRASFPGPSQLRWEHLSTMYTSGAGDLLFAFCSQLVAGDLPLEARPWLGGAPLVAILKDVDDDGRPIPTASGGGVRPIAMGEVLRKLLVG
jgi:hypothetical protein